MRKICRRSWTGCHHVKAKVIFLSIPSIKWLRPPSAPKVQLTLDKRRIGMTTKEIAEKLKNGGPPIAVIDRPEAIYLNPQYLKDGEEQTCCKKIKGDIKK